MRKDKVVESQGEGNLPAPWSAATEYEETLGDVFIDTVGGQPAIGLRNHEGPATVKLIARPELLRTKTGKKYAVKLAYQTEANGFGHVATIVNGQEVNRTELAKSPGSWKDAEVTVTAAADGALTLAIGCDSVGSESSIYLRAIEVRELQ